MPVLAGQACPAAMRVKDDADSFNPHGGAIRIGHPMGMSGARLAMTAVHGMEKRGGSLPGNQCASGSARASRSPIEKAVNCPCLTRFLRRTGAHFA